MFKKRKQSSNVRKRPRQRQAKSTTSDDSDAPQNDVFHNNHNNSSDDNDDDDEALVISRGTANKTKKSKFSSVSTKASTSKSALVQEYKTGFGPKTGKELATAHSEYTKDETKADIAAAEAAKVGEEDEKGNKLYTGNKGSRNKFLAGPLRAPAFVRTTCVFDYQPNICKDYKETGFCGFGDSCIYLHDRSDTVAGWQLEAQWEAKKKEEEKRKERQMNRFLKCTEVGSDSNIENSDDEGQNIASSDDDLPFACYICRQKFTDPVVTSCGHYFCEKCIMASYKNNPACPICKKDTLGVFNYPQKLFAKRKKLGCKTWEEYFVKLSRN